MSCSILPQPAAPNSCNRPPYFQGLPDVFADSGDLELHMEGKVLKAHSALLSMHSSVFGNILLDLKKDCHPSAQQPLVVPMIGDNLEGVQALLACIYKASSSLAPTINEIINSWLLAAPAHKYGFTAFLSYCDVYWSMHFSGIHPSLVSMEHSSYPAFVAYAERHGLPRTLAALELLLINTGTPAGFTFAATMSPQSLARVVKGLELRCASKVPSEAAAPDSGHMQETFSLLRSGCIILSCLPVELC